MSNQNEPGSQVLAQAIPDDSFPDLETMDHDYLYIILANFIHKAVPIKGSELTIINGFNNRVASPEAPFIILQILQEQQLSSNETRYTNTHKIVKYISEVIIQIQFYGNKAIRASKMAKAFSLRFNDSWATEQFAQYGQVFFPLYCDDIKSQPFMDMEDQYADFYTVTAYFEYHPEVGMCQDSAKELCMQTKPVF